MLVYGEGGACKKDENKQIPGGATQETKARTGTGKPAHE